MAPDGGMHCQQLIIDYECFVCNYSYALRAGRTNVDASLLQDFPKLAEQANACPASSRVKPCSAMDQDSLDCSAPVAGWLAE